MKKSIVEEVVYLSNVSFEEVEVYQRNILQKNLGLQTVILDTLKLEEIQSFWKKINPLVHELHIDNNPLQEDKKYIKLLTETDIYQILNKLVVIASVNHPLQHEELFIEHLVKKIVYESNQNESLTIQSIVDWKNDVEAMQDTETKSKLLPSYLQLLHGISCVHKYVDNTPCLDISRILEKGESVYLTPGIMCKNTTMLCMANLFLVEIVKWVEGREDFTRSTAINPQVMIVNSHLYSEKLITRLSRSSVRKGVQLILHVN